MPKGLTNKLISYHLSGLINFIRLQTIQTKIGPFITCYRAAVTEAWALCISVDMEIYEYILESDCCNYIESLSGEDFQSRREILTFVEDIKSWAKVDIGPLPTVGRWRIQKFGTDRSSLKHNFEKKKMNRPICREDKVFKYSSLSQKIQT